MMGSFRGKLTYANVMATIAVFVALGGASYAAVSLPAKSVGTKQIKNGAVTGLKVRDASLTPADFGGTLPAGQPGSRGLQGQKGEQGLQGNTGATGPDGVLQTLSFDGSISGTMTSSANWQFVGPTDTTTLTAGEQLSGTAVMSLGAAAAVPVSSGLCLQPAAGEVVPMTSAYQTTSISGRQVVAASASAAPAAGFYTVGPCVRFTAGTLDNSNTASGWFVVTK
jgi:hypothetical protein